MRNDLGFLLWSLFVGSVALVVFAIAISPSQKSRKLAWMQGACADAGFSVRQCELLHAEKVARDNGDAAAAGLAVGFGAARR